MGGWEWKGRGQTPTALKNSAEDLVARCPSSLNSATQVFVIALAFSITNIIMGESPSSGRVRVLYVNESESLGPAMARYFASKLWGGESYFMQASV